MQLYCGGFPFFLDVCYLLQAKRFQKLNVKTSLPKDFRQKTTDFKTDLANEEASKVESKKRLGKNFCRQQLSSNVMNHVSNHIKRHVGSKKTSVSK